MSFRTVTTVDYEASEDGEGWSVILSQGRGTSVPARIYFHYETEAEAFAAFNAFAALIEPVPSLF